jgi:hypothetical protein
MTISLGTGINADSRTIKKNIPEYPELEII